MKTNNAVTMVMRTAAVGMMCALTGCVSSSKVDLRQSTSTAVSLSGKNYKLIQGGATGRSYGFWLLGVLPVASPHYASARRDLYEKVDEPLTGRSVALANTMEDRSTSFWLLFSVPKLTVTADVIEFIDGSEVKGSAAK